MRIRLIALLAVALSVFFIPAAQAQSDTATVFVVHGIPDVPVDVYVDGALTLEDFQPTDIAGPLDLPEGSYEIEIFAAGADPDADDPVIGPVTADVPAGANISVVAHLDADGAPTLTPFVNDTDTVAAGDARVTVRHTAAAPAVDILVFGEPVFEGLENPDEAVADLPADTYEVAVAPAGSTDPVIGPVDLELPEGVNTIAYAIGSLEDDTLDVIIQTISGLHEVPDGVESGLGGLKAAEQARAAQMPWVIALASITLLGAGVGARRAVGSRR